MSKDNRQHRPQLDGLRGLGICTILYAHFWHEGSTLGEMAIRLFFVLSGFLITGILLDMKRAAPDNPGTSFKIFYIRRTLRIFPAYYAFLALCWLIDIEGSREGFLWHLFYASNFWFAIQDSWDPWVLMQLWSLATEEQFYLCWPFAVLFLSQRKLTYLIVAAVLSSFAYRFYIATSTAYEILPQVLPPESWDALTVGAALALYWQHADYILTRLRIPALISAIAVLALFIDFSLPSHLKVLDLSFNTDWIIRSVASLILFPYIVGAAHKGIGGIVGQILESKPVVFMGAISYAVYLYHSLALALTARGAYAVGFRELDPSFAMFVAASTLSILFGVASRHIVEQPVNRLKSRFQYRSRAPRSQKAETEPTG